VLFLAEAAWAVSLTNVMSTVFVGCHDVVQQWSNIVLVLVPDIVLRHCGGDAAASLSEPFVPRETSALTRRVFNLPSEALSRRRVLPVATHYHKP
jgi:hypothetical protein